MFEQIVMGYLCSAIIGYLAHRAGALNASGAWAAAIVGGAIFGFGGLGWAALLMMFFVSSSALSRAFRNRKSAIDEKYAKGSQRDWGQVLANGGLGALLAIAAALFPDQEWLWLAFIGAMAAVNADTWATELGVLNPTPPRLITTGRAVERGTSGGVSLVGYLAVVGGSALVGLVALPFSAGSWLATLAAALVGGLAGSTLDSLLGASVQAIYYCPSCQKETERHPYHSCGGATTHQRGWRWLDNDWVNFSCSLGGAVGAVLAGMLLLG
jgi:uncharacterized protein (TIGR00297 family)